MYIFDKKDANYRADYVAITKELNQFSEEKKFQDMLGLINGLAKNDLFFLLYFVLNVMPVNDPWIVQRIREVEESHNRTLDLWAREHFKSTIITFALTIQKILNNPDTRIVIFSNTKSQAKKFLRRIKHTLEQNRLLQLAFPHIFYEKPDRQSKKWSEDDGLLVKRKGVFQEMTLEAHGVTEAMPTGLHFPIRVYDDLVTWDTTRTADQILKTEEGFEMSHNLGVTGGGEVRVIGTRYDFNDLYNGMIKSGNWIVREHAGDVEPTYWPPAVIEQKRKDMGKYIFATQISLKPLSEDDQKFELNWIKNYETPSKGLNIYLLIDPAGDGKKGKSSYTVMHAVGVDWNHNKTLLDTVRDKLDLYGRWCCLRDLYLKHSREGNVLGVGYEKYSMQADIQYIQEKQLEENVIFSITQLGGNMNKNDRIRKLIPDFEQGKWFLPYEYWYTDSEGKKRDLIKEFLEEEYIHFPNVSYKDMLDALARIYDSDLCVVYPSVRAEEKKAPQEGDWMRLIKRSGGRNRWAAT